jgi:dTDP-4-amino-4,6-dideoxygalactose transaminase
VKLSNNLLEATIADLFGYSHAVLFGRARSGIVALLDVLGLGQDAPFVMPSNLCSSLLMAILSSGAKVDLAEVSALNGLASDATLVDVMKQSIVPGLVMPAHLYGFVQPYEQTLSYAKAHKWFVLENDTIATRVRFGGASRSAFGDALLVSFGYAKTIEAGGGGALLTDDVALARALRLRARSFKPLDEAANRAETEFMLFERHLRNEVDQRNGLSILDREKKLFSRVPECRHGFPESLLEPLAAAINKLPDTLEFKRNQVEKWNRCLEPFNHILLPPDINCEVPWRLIRRVPKIRNNTVIGLRNNGFDAGTNFPPLTASFPSLISTRPIKGAEKWGSEVLNLWLSSEYDSSRMNQLAETIEATLLNA